MNAYVMTDDGAHVIEGAGCLEIRPDQVALIRGGGPDRQILAAVRLSDRVWVSIGERLPAGPPASPRPDRTPAHVGRGTGDGDWPFEPPPDVDSGG